MSTLYAYITCESSTEVVPSFEFQYRGCTKFLFLRTKFVQVSEYSTKVVPVLISLNLTGSVWVWSVGRGSVMWAGCL